MIIKGIKINNYGKLQNREMKLSEGLNIFFGKRKKPGAGAFKTGKNVYTKSVHHRVRFYTERGEPFDADSGLFQKNGRLPAHHSFLYPEGAAAPENG